MKPVNEYLLTTVTEGKEDRKFVYFIEDTHPAYKGLWFGMETYPVTSWTSDFKAWTNDPLKAHAFATFEEADKVRIELNMDGYIVTEHEFVNQLYVDKSQNAQPSEPSTLPVVDYEKEANSKLLELIKMIDGRIDYWNGKDSLTGSSIVKVLLGVKEKANNLIQQTPGK